MSSAATISVLLMGYSTNHQNPVISHFTECLNLHQSSNCTQCGSTASLMFLKKNCICLLFSISPYFLPPNSHPLANSLLSHDDLQDMWSQTRHLFELLLMLRHSSVLHTKRHLPSYAYMSSRLIAVINSAKSVMPALPSWQHGKFCIITIPRRLHERFSSNVSIKVM